MTSGEASGDGSAPHVLPVDDSVVDRASASFGVTAVDSGKRALELLLCSASVSMIISDYWMPEMTGYELLKKVKESSKLKEIHSLTLCHGSFIPNYQSRLFQ